MVKAARTFRVNVVTGQGGGGHYATYRALKAIAKRRNLPWEFQVTDMDDIITELAQAGDIQNAYEKFGMSGHDLYNLMVKGGWTWLWPLKMRLNKLMVRMNHQVGVNIFAEHWRSQQPDIVVSVMPLYNKGLYESLQKAKPGTPYVTVMTDFADCPPAFWLDPEAGNTVVCGTQRAVEQAQSLDISPNRLVQSSGLVIHPSFYTRADLSMRELGDQRRALGLDTDKPTGIVTFGGNGSKEMIAIAERLERLGNRGQFIFVCGRNAEVADAIRAYSGLQKRVVVGFADDMASYMQLSDFFVGKPGNVSVSEALAMNLPVITECSWRTMSQEKYCAQWVEAQGVGLVVPTFDQVVQAVEQIIQPETHAQYRANLKRLSNRAVFEVADLIEAMLKQTGSVELPEEEINEAKIADVLA